MFTSLKKGAKFTVKVLAAILVINAMIVAAAIVAAFVLS